MKRRIFSMILAAILVFTGVDITAFAQADSGTEVQSVEVGESVEESTKEPEETVNPTETPSTEPIQMPDATETPTEVPTETSAASAEPTSEATVSPTETPEATETPIASVEPSLAASETSTATEEPTSATTQELATEVEAEDFQITENTILTEDKKVTGDLYIKKGNDLFLDGHTLEVSGDAEIYGDIDLGGGSLIIHGNVLHTYGGITFAGGSMTIGGDYHLEELEKDGTYSKGSGSFKMENSADVLDVNGDFYCNSATNDLSAGTITFAGDVTILTMFKCTGTNKMIFDGAEKQNICFGINNDQIYANELNIQNDKVVVESLSFAKLLSDAIIDADDADIWAYNGNTALNLNGHCLTINGDVNLRGGSKGIDLASGTLMINGNLVHPSGKIAFNGGKLEVSGDYRIATKETDNLGQEIYTSSGGYLVMNQPQDLLDVEGDFITQSSAGSNYELTAGTINLAGDVRIEDRFFRGKNIHRVVFDGSEEQNIYVSQVDNYFNEVEFKNENVTVESIGFCKLVADAQFDANDAVLWAGDPVLKSENSCKLTLDGHQLTVNGNITVGIYQYFALNLAGGELIVNGDLTHTAGDLVFNRGKLMITGDYRGAKKTVTEGGETDEEAGHAALFMSYPEDYMDVDGDFKSNSTRSTNTDLKAGIMELAGDVVISDTYFKFSGTHKVILDGNEKQTIIIPNRGAFFNILQLTKKMDNYEFHPYGCWKKLLKAKDILIKYVDTYYYTGQAIMPEVEVYEGETLLEKDKDYTVSYKNNVKVNPTASGKNPPTIIVKGKGGYKGTNTETFKILKRDIADEEIVVEEFTASYSGTALKKTPVLTHNGKKLVAKTDFTVSYPDLSEGAYKEVGTYTVLIKGKGSYTGSREVSFTVTPVKFMKDVTVSTIATQPYTGAAVTLQTMKTAPIIKHGTTVLSEGVHFTASYENNLKVGTATITLTGTEQDTPEGFFKGSKVVTFKISGKSLAKAKVTGIPKTMTYNGQEINDLTDGWGKAIKVTLSGKTLTRAADEDSAGDYVVVFAKNVNKGTASVTIKGVNNYAGSVKKTFAIAAYNINDNKGLNLVTEEMVPSIVFVKGGSKPEPVVKFGETVLTKGKDYTLTYKNNTKFHSGTGKNKPTVTITGKGNFKGSVKYTFAIEKQNIGVCTLTAPDATYKKEKGAYKSALVVKDVNGKALKSGTDFTATYAYAQDVTTVNKKERKAGDAVKATDIVPAGTLLRVTVSGKGSYTAENPLTATYLVVKGSVANAKVTVPSQKYTGEPIIFENTPEDKAKIKVVIGKQKLKPEDFEIVDGSFENNTDAGTASFTIKGVGNYGGIKKVTYQITKKKFDAWWRVIFR